MCLADWWTVISENDVDNSVENFMKIIIPSGDKHAPYKTINCQEKGAEWVTNDFLALTDAREF